MKQFLALIVALRAGLACCQDNVSVPPDLRTALQDEIRETQEQEWCMRMDFPPGVPWFGAPGHGSAPLAYGLPPFENSYAPGLFSAVLASEGATENYLLMRARMDYMTHLGYFKAERETFIYPATEPVNIKYQTIASSPSSGELVLSVEALRRPQPAIRYTLTYEGWLATRGKPCLPLGKNELIDVQSIQRLDQKRDDIFQVEYRVGVRAEVIQLERTALVRAFGESVVANLHPRSMKTKFIHGAAGWTSERRMLIQQSVMQERRPLAQPSDAELQRALDTYLDGVPSRRQTCIGLPSAAQMHGTTAGGASHARSYSGTFFDFPNAFPERAREVSRGLRLARDLERAGVLSMQPATPQILQQPDERGGGRFDLNPDYYRFLRTTPPSSCLAYAELTAKVGWMQLQGGAQTLEFLAIAHPKRFYEWVENSSAAKELPGVRHLRQHGIGLKGTAVYATNAWHVQKAELFDASYAPAVNASELFAALPRAADYRRANAAKTTPEIQAIVVRSGGMAFVRVEGTGRPLILHLSSAVPAEWRLNVAPGAGLIRVVASTPTVTKVQGVPKGIPVVVYSGEDKSGRRPDQEFIPTLLPPGVRFFGAGIHTDTGDALQASGSNNIAVLEQRLGGEVTVIQPEQSSKKQFTVPRRWQAP